MKWSNNPIIVNLKHNRGRITTPLAHILVAPLNNQFIASYPRSGSTWLRTMLTNVINPTANSNPDIFNRMIPGTTLTRLWLAYHTPKPHLLATHSIYRKSIRRVVYVMRDARDSVLSLYRYTTIRDGIHMDFERWFSYYKRGWYGPRWEQHVESWLIRGRGKLGDNMLIVKYEDLCAAPHSNLEQVCDFLGIDYDRNDLDRAINLSSIDNMRNWERKLLDHVKDESASFYRGKKKAPEWMTLLNEQQRDEFMRLCRNALRLAGYMK